MPQKNSPLRIMTVVCHPADAIDGAGGTMCLHAERGDQVTVVVCTHGVETHDLKRNDSARFEGAVADQTGAISKKEKEVLEGMAILGVTDVRFLRFSDELFTVTPELIEAIAGVMAEVQPDLLILHNPTEERGIADIGHADSAIATLKSRSLANSPRFLKERGLKNHGRRFPAQVFFYTMNGNTTQLTFEGMRFGSTLIDITPAIERKVRAMDCLKSQYYTGHLARKCLEVINGQMGLHLCLPYAEAFQANQPHVYSHLPLNDHLRMLANTPDREHYVNLRNMTHEIPVHESAE